MTGKFTISEYDGNGSLVHEDTLPNPVVYFSKFLLEKGLNMKKKSVGVKQLKKVLSSCAVLTGPISIIIEQNDPNFYEIRAKELMSEAKLCLGFGTPNEHQLARYEETMSKAITLLGLAICLRKNNEM